MVNKPQPDMKLWNVGLQSYLAKPPRKHKNVALIRAMQK